VRWYLQGKPVPPPHIIKQRLIKRLQRRFGTRTFVESGTYLGDMVFSVKDVFKIIYSIELSPELARKAQERFSPYPHVHLLQGDSGQVLPEVLQSISEPSLFWLDGHYSGGATARGDCDYPILQELKHIKNHCVRSHVILIDDARLFDGEKGTPSLKEIGDALLEINSSYRVEITSDVVVACL
jgi:hypothetical protein